MKIYTEQEAINESNKSFDGDLLAATTWVNKYAMRNENKELLEKCPRQMHKRIAKEIVRVEKSHPNPTLSEQRVFDLLHKWGVIPGGSGMSGIGNRNKFTSLSNCFVIGVEGNGDSYGSILHIDQEQIQLMKRRGGVGHDLSKLRPATAIVTNDAQTSSGLTSFMKRYSNSTREVGQGGRRGALMLSVSVKHPDAENFIDAKLEKGEITGANISVRLSDEFMRCAIEDKTYLQTFPIDATKRDLFGTDSGPVISETGVLYEGVKPGTYYRYVDAKKLWKKVIHNAWKSAEPGCLFWDTIINESPSDFYSDKGFETISTNPCFSGDSILSTSLGDLQLEDLVGIPGLKAYNSSGELVDCIVQPTKIVKEYLKVTFKDKVTGEESITKCTLDHMYPTYESGNFQKDMEARDLIGRELKTYVNSNFDGLNFVECTGIELVSEALQVYDFTLGGEDHYGWINGVLTHNCGELPLPPYDSCRLIAINLLQYVINPWTRDAKVDWGRLYSDSRDVQRIMDNIIDLELEAIDRIIAKVESDPEAEYIKSIEKALWLKIRDKAERGRRTGVGVTAEGDFLAALGLRYGSKESIKEATTAHRTVALGCYSMSIQLAKERGAFPEWNKKELEGDKALFLKRIFPELSEADQRDWLEYGRRNIANLTIAPTGTVSLMTSTTSGIEPAFKLWYTRRRKTSDKSKCNFIGEDGDMYEEFFVLHKGFVDWYYLNQPEGEDRDRDECKEFLSNSNEDVLNTLYKRSPYYKSTANDIDWVSKVEMQGSVQKWVDHSISCTVNVPKSTEVGTISKIYQKAWETGCKGVTIYREGSRDGILVDASESQENKKPFLDRPRPDELPAKIYRFKNGSENWIAFIGMMDGRPYEIFCGKVDDDIRFLPKSVNDGKIIRVRQEDLKGGRYNRYDFQYEIHYGYINTLPAISAVFKSEYWNYARMISGIMRFGLPIPEIVNIIDGLNSDMGDLINSWKKGVSRALTKFIKDGEVSSRACDICGGELIYQDGCKTCSGCGESKCG